MPSPKSHRRLLPEEKNRRGKLLTERSSSVHGQISGTVTPPQIRRPKTLPDMFSFRNAVETTTASEVRPKLTKLLLNVTIQGSVGAVQVLMSPESTVGDLMAAAVRQYGKEGRRPILPSVDPACFDLHYSQFSLESLDREEKLIALGSRNFFMCPEKSGSGTASSGAVSCAKQAEKASRSGWLNFMGFLL